MEGPHSLRRKTILAVCSDVAERTRIVVVADDDIPIRLVVKSV